MTRLESVAAVSRLTRARAICGIVLAILTFAGCSVGSSPSKELPVASVPVIDPPSIVSEKPIHYPSDNMWAFLASSAEGSRQADTLEGAVEFADVVLVGRYVGLERGARYGSDWLAVAKIEVDQTVKGTPKLGPDGLLRIEFVLVVGGGSYPERTFNNLARSIPTEPALLYLSTWASYLELIGGGFPDLEARKDLDSIYRTIGGDGAMRIVAGKMAPSSHVEGWPSTLRGVDLDTVLDRIRAVKP